MTVRCDIDALLVQVVELWGTPDEPADGGAWEPPMLLLRTGTSVHETLGTRDALMDALEAPWDVPCEEFPDERLWMETTQDVTHDGWILNLSGWQEPDRWLRVFLDALDVRGVDGELLAVRPEPLPRWFSGTQPLLGDNVLPYATLHVTPHEHVWEDRELRYEMYQLLAALVGPGLGTEPEQLNYWQFDAGLINCSYKQVIELMVDSPDLLQVAVSERFRAGVARLGNLPLSISEDCPIRFPVVSLWRPDDMSCDNIELLVEALPSLVPYAYEAYVHNGHFQSRHDYREGGASHFEGPVEWGRDSCVQLVPAGTDLSVPREKGWSVDALPGGEHVVRVGAIEPNVITRVVLDSEEKLKPIVIDVPEAR